MLKKKNYLIRFCILGVFLISFPLLETQLINPISIKNPISSTGTNIPIIINGNDEIDSFFLGNSSTGLWEGSPYILENLGIDTSELGYGIRISNTNRHLIIQDSSIMSSQSPAIGKGIELDNCSNIKIIGNVLSENFNGLEIRNSDFISISYNEILENEKDGVVISNSFNISFADNVISNNYGNGIYLNGVTQMTADIVWNDDGIIFNHIGTATGSLALRVTNSYGEFDEVSITVNPVLQYFYPDTATAIFTPDGAGTYAGGTLPASVQDTGGGTYDWYRSWRPVPFDIYGINVRFTGFNSGATPIYDIKVNLHSAVYGSYSDSYTYIQYTISHSGGTATGSFNQWGDIQVNLNGNTLNYIHVKLVAVPFQGGPPDPGTIQFDRIYAYTSTSGKDLNPNDNSTVVENTFAQYNSALNITGSSGVNKYALITGISDYQSNYFGNLNYADDDANDWYDYFISQGYQVWVLGDGTSSYTQYDGLATEENVRGAIQLISQIAGENDEVAFVFSGHGRKYGVDGSYFGMYDWMMNGSNADGSYSDVELEFDFANLTANNLFLFFDTCFSGGMNEVLSNPNITSTYMTTASDTGWGFDQPDLQQGAWTYFFLKQGLELHPGWNMTTVYEYAFEEYKNYYIENISTWETWYGNERQDAPVQFINSIDATHPYIDLPERTIYNFTEGFLEYNNMDAILFEAFVSNLTQEEFMEWSFRQLPGYNDTIIFEKYIDWVEYDEYTEFKAGRLYYNFLDFLTTTIDEYF